MQRRLRRLVLRGTALLAALTAMTAVPAAAAPGFSEGLLTDDLYLVTMSGPGTAGYTGTFSTTDYRTGLVQRQDATLRTVGAPEPVQRWTTALSGMSVRLDAIQAVRIRSVPGVRLVERDRVHRLAGVASAAGAAAAPTNRRGGAGTVIGFVDSGIDTRGPVFADSSRLGRMPDSFSGACPEGGWGDSACNRKVVAARHFVDAFGADQVRSGSSISPQDDQGHGTMVAALAAGNAASPTGPARRVAARFRGAAPDARIAVYKACWEAPDPDDDGCASADVVTAIDAAVADGVDVLNLSVEGSRGLDTVDLALLGAAEHDVVVVAAAGNDGNPTGHETPWVTTVGAVDAGNHRGSLVLADGTRLRGTLTAAGVKERHDVVAARAIPAPGSSPDEAALCGATSLDAARADDRIVVCERGEIPRLEKSRTVRLAGGSAMVLLNSSDEELTADLHALPTLNLDAREARKLRQVLAAGSVRARLTPAKAAAPRLLDWSSTGSAKGLVAKPDLVAPGLGLLTATSPRTGRGRWDLLSGSSGSAAQVSGAAARLRSQHGSWSAARTRSVLANSATPLPGTVVRSGSGVLDLRAASSARLGQDVRVTAWREFLDGERDDLNLPSVLAASGRTSVVRRQFTNVGDRPGYWSVSVSGFARNRVEVFPRALQLRADQRHTIRIRVTPDVPGSRRTDDGFVVWRDDAGNRVRIPVTIR